MLVASYIFCCNFNQDAQCQGGSVDPVGGQVGQAGAETNHAFPPVLPPPRARPWAQLGHPVSSAWEHSTPRDARPEPRKAVPGHTCPPGLQGIAVQGHPCPICPWILPVHACRTVLRLQERGAAGACGQEGTRPPVGTWGWWPLRALT